MSLQRIRLEQESANNKTDFFVSKSLKAKLQSSFIISLHLLLIASGTQSSLRLCVGFVWLNHKARYLTSHSARSWDLLVADCSLDALVLRFHLLVAMAFLPVLPLPTLIFFLLAELITLWLDFKIDFRRVQFARQHSLRLDWARLGSLKYNISYHEQHFLRHTLSCLFS